jgi:DNA-binding response OmpR family regulator
MEQETHILIIEDEIQTLNIVRDCLEAEGFKVMGTENSKVGLELIRNQLPDVVICDILIPDLDGYEVLTLLRKDPTTRDIPFIFLTGKTTEAERCYGLKLGADGYLTKPCTVEKLLEAIADVSKLNQKQVMPC